MPHDPELVAETKAWCVKASEDLGAAAYLLNAEPPFLSDIVFHAQQAVENWIRHWTPWLTKPCR